MKRVIRQSSKNFLLDLSYIYLIISQATTDGEENGPKFVEPIPNVTVTVGRDASLPCVVNNLGTYKVLWIHIDRKMVVTMHKHVISRIPRYSISVNNKNSWILHVTRVQQEDRGYYMCQVNTNPIMSQVGYLQVIVPPVFIEDGTTSSATVAVRENQNLTLTCKAQGFPPPRIVWKREDAGDIVLNKKTKGPAFTGEKIHFERISRTDIAGYLCIAANGAPPAVIKKIFINVEFSPIVIVTNQLIASSLGSNVVLECQTEANPLATTYWMLNDDYISQSSKHNIRTTSNSYRTYTKLIIQNITKSDFGEYRCLSKNSLGETEGTVRLYEYITSTTIESLAQITTVHSAIFHKGTTDTSPHHRIQNKIEKNHLFKSSLKFNVSSNLHSPPYNINEILFPKKITNSADHTRWNLHLLIFGYVHIIIKYL
ncbi:lachesin-like isoform X2 [Planococcus citri]|uniref:lachesin-like isoform X2 n=1 Tax=Planococcus citri TaxID=170843 RepID=UPI0031F9FD17